MLGGRFTWGSQFQRCPSIDSQLHGSEAGVRQIILAEECEGGAGIGTQSTGALGDTSKQQPGTLHFDTHVQASL